MADEELNAMIEELCLSKAEEFRLIGYEHVTGKEVWECVSAGYVKTGQPGLHKMVNDILSLKVTQFMNHMTLSAYKGTSF
ncbi:post-transcriptional regulator [Paenibacillus sp. LHD-117]|uniref:post-transcriptional regulator n=1 Tax=Paenibacillus sp. LHD-117 TaxID=3071412 RepID=UPI0027E02382|nr:post-transcriptional regulator [Paenibacillus sp. LHD-117]MDQ6418598.1 post-transcriptional regulator [Paenibacillus sp. LHD-117]